jgi:hypothetical protein
VPGVRRFDVTWQGVDILLELGFEEEAIHEAKKLIYEGIQNTKDKYTFTALNKLEPLLRKKNRQ